MKIKLKDVENAAVLSRLILSAEEKENYTETLNSILGYMEMLNSLDTADVEPTTHVLPLRNIYREDLPGVTLDRAAVLSNAPESEEGCFKVPRIV